MKNKTSKEETQRLYGVLIVFALVALFFWWMNQPTELPEPDYLMPPKHGEVRSFDYKNDKWNYYNTDNSKLIIPSERKVEYRKPRAQTMSEQREFQEDMDEYDRDNDWGD